MKHGLIGLIVALTLSGCSTSSDGITPSDTSDAEWQDAGNGCMALTAENVDEFVTYAVGANDSKVPCTRDAIDAVRTDERVIQGLFDELAGQWSVRDGGESAMGDGSRIVVVLHILKQIGSPDRADDLNSYAWRAGSSFDLTVAESYVAEALACVHTDGARALVQAIIDGHPNESVRNAAATQIVRQACRYMQPAFP